MRTLQRGVPSQIVRLIDVYFPNKDNKGQHIAPGPETVSSVDGILALLDTIPSQLITLDEENYGKFVKAVARVRIFSRDWANRVHPTSPLGPTPSFEGKNPLFVIRDSLALCPDEYPAAASNELLFVGDPELRASLVGDLGTVSTALANAEWKAATVLAGSLVEALLLWRLSLVESSAILKAPSFKPESLEKWDLHDYIEVSADLGIIKAETAGQARLARNFRNLIHPGRAARLGQTCDRGTALSAAAAVHLVIRDLS